MLRRRRQLKVCSNTEVATLCGLGICKSFLAIYGTLQASRLFGAADSRGCKYRISDLIYGSRMGGRG